MAIDRTGWVVSYMPLPCCGFIFQSVACINFKPSLEMGVKFNITKYYSHYVLCQHVQGVSET